MQRQGFSSKNHCPLGFLVFFTDAGEEFQTSRFLVWHDIMFSQYVKYLQKIGGRENVILFCQIIPLGHGNKHQPAMQETLVQSLGRGDKTTVILIKTFYEIMFYA